MSLEILKEEVKSFDFENKNKEETTSFFNKVMKEVNSEFLYRSSESKLKSYNFLTIFFESNLDFKNKIFLGAYYPKEFSLSTEFQLNIMIDPEMLSKLPLYILESVIKEKTLSYEVVRYFLKRNKLLFYEVFDNYPLIKEEKDFWKQKFSTVEFRDEDFSSLNLSEETEFYNVSFTDCIFNSDSLDDKGILRLNKCTLIECSFKKVSKRLLMRLQTNNTILRPLFI